MTTNHINNADFVRLANDLISLGGMALAPNVRGYKVGEAVADIINRIGELSNGGPYKRVLGGEFLSATAIKEATNERA